MMTEAQTLQIGADRSKGPVSAILQKPENAKTLYVMAHGAGADMRHRFLQSMADELEGTGIATLRFNFPYTEQGRKAPDPQLCSRPTFGRLAGRRWKRGRACRFSRVANQWAAA